MNIFRTLSPRVDAYREEIDTRNRRNLVLLSSGALPFSLAIFIISAFFLRYHNLAVVHGILFLYSLVLFFFARFSQQRKLAHIRAVFYLALAPFLVGTVFLGTYCDPNRPAISIMIFLCVLPLFVIDKPWRILLYQMLFAGLFVLCGFFAKAPEVFRADLLYMPIYLLIGMGANLFSLIDKIESAENFVRMRRESERDSLTGLFNRRAGKRMVTALLQDQIRGTFAILDVDDFKKFNDTYGHQAGDEVLQEVSHAICSVFRASDVVWRLGGDEFAVYAVGLLDQETCRRRFTALSARLRQLRRPQGEPFSVSVSVGCTLCLRDGLAFDALYTASDNALYQAKHAGKGSIVIRPGL